MRRIKADLFDDLPEVGEVGVLVEKTIDRWNSQATRFDLFHRPPTTNGDGRELTKGWLGTHTSSDATTHREAHGWYEVTRSGPTGVELVRYAPPET